ncbi:hypothetical protein ACQ4PT_022276 [Festuca glaucescens]
MRSRARPAGSSLMPDGKGVCRVWARLEPRDGGVGATGDLQGWVGKVGLAVRQRRRKGCCCVLICVVELGSHGGACTPAPSPPPSSPSRASVVDREGSSPPCADGGWGDLLWRRKGQGSVLAVAAPRRRVSAGA